MSNTSLARQGVHHRTRRHRRGVDRVRCWSALGFDPMIEQMFVAVTEVGPGLVRVTVIREWRDPSSGLVLDASAEDLGVQAIMPSVHQHKEKTHNAESTRR